MRDGYPRSRRTAGERTTLSRVRGRRVWTFWALLAWGALLSAPASGAGFSLSSSAFAPGAQIPASYTCVGSNLSPPLRWEAPPPGTRSFVLVVTDPDAPGGEFVHWVLYDLPGSMSALPEGVPGLPTVPGGARQGVNDFRRVGYGGPCPPPGRPHRYVFTLYALDLPRLPVRDRATRVQVTHAMAGHILDTATLTALFGR